jgi:Tfp pilus assembly protein PilZ
MVEKRRFSRLQAKEKVFLRKEEDLQQEALLLDVGLGGMRILLDNKIDVGSPILGQFEIIPNLGPFYIQGEVIWVKPVVDKTKHTGFEVGIKFTKVSTIPI